MERTALISYHKASQGTSLERARTMQRNFVAGYLQANMAVQMKRKLRWLLLCPG
jgi:hypothetical protein